MHAIPKSEIDFLARHIRDTPGYASPRFVLDVYSSFGLDVWPDPFSPDVSGRVIAALQEGTPLSVVRIGDGEANLLTFRRYAGTPDLDRYSVIAVMALQRDGLPPGESWMLLLREMMLSSILQADIVGVIGLWRSNANFTAEKLVDRLSHDPRGATGHWRAIDYMLRLGRDGALDGKMVASAHLYFGVIEHLAEILAHASRILVITDRTAVVAALGDRFPGKPVDLVEVGRTPGEPANGDVLAEVDKRLPLDLRGCCCLIGAGPWAEIYCGWIKQRGGVAIDIGSGFDLLDGTVSRPIHKEIGLDRANKYSLRPRAGTNTGT